jgi:hypothetical protein
MKKTFLTIVALFAFGISQAQIVYTSFESAPIAMDAQYTMDHEPGYGINLMNGETEFYIQNYGEMMSYVACFEQGAQVVGVADNDLQATITPLAANTQIGSSSSFQGNTDGNPAFPVLYYSPSYTTWGGQTAYVGFKFKGGSNTYYGWIKLKVENTNATNPIITLYSYAYQSTPNTAILAGDMGNSSINEVENSNIKIYPNPTTDYLTVTGVENAKEINISNVLGEKVMTLTTKDNKIDVSNLNNGVYFINMTTNDKVYSQKFIKR